MTYIETWLYNNPYPPGTEGYFRWVACQRECLDEWDTVNDPPCHPSDKDWKPCKICVDRIRNRTNQTKFEDRNSND